MTAEHSRTLRHPLESRWVRAAVTLVAGALPALAFPAPALWWLAWVVLVPWLLLARSAGSAFQAALTGWLGGTGFMLAVHHWMLPSLHVFMLLLAALLGLLWAPWAWLVWRLMYGRPGPYRLAAAVTLVPSAWLMVELVRSWEYLGGPWGLLGASQWQVTAMLRLASVGGVWLLSFVLVAVNTALAALIAAPAVRDSTVRALPTALAGLVALAVAAGTVAAAWVWAPAPRQSGGTRIAVVQPGVIVGQRARLERSVELTRQLAGQRMDLVVWGESSVSYDLGAHPELRRSLAALSSEVGARILVNVDARRSDKPGIFKSSILIGPQGTIGKRYDKTRLVPFGEYVPARSLLGWATSVGRAADEDRLRGDGPVVMEAAGVKFGPLVCFETAFPDMSRQLVREGTGLLVAQSSTSTFQGSWAPAQHASLAALRAAETGRPMVHATLTGRSAVYDARGGNLGDWLGTDRSTAKVYRVPLATGETLYVRLGDWVVYAAVAALLVFAATEAVRVWRNRRRQRGSSTSNLNSRPPARR
jgi:apolipoprotein N-acyltransferase